MLTVLCWGGIGDTLRNIALLPHQALYRAFGLRTKVVHLNWRAAGCLPHAGAPEPEVFKDLIDRIPSLEWRGESDEHRGLSRTLNRLLRDGLRLLHGGHTRYFPIEVQLSEAERAALPPETVGLQIGLQTHLTGMLTKRWGTANWRVVIEGLLATHPDCAIRLLDASPEVDALCLDPRVTSTRQLNLGQSINLIAGLDLLVSIESWTKYVAAWHGIPQVIIVPDMTSEYGASTAEKLSQVELAGIIDNPANIILGIEGASPNRTLSLPKITDLSPDTLLTAVATAVQSLPAQSRR